MIEIPKPPVKTYQKLQYLMSVRVRLDDEQRQILKTAYNNYRNQHQVPAPPAIGGSSITSTTVQAVPPLLDMSNIVITDLLATRESIPLPTVLRLSSALGVEVVTKDVIREQLESYLDHCWSSTDIST